MALKHLMLICLVSLVTMSMVISPSFSAIAYYNFNSTAPLYNATIMDSPNSSNIYQVTWAFAANTTNSTYAQVYSSIQVDGVVSYMLPTFNRTYSNDTNGSPQVTQYSGSIDPCVTSSVNNQTISFVISEATTDATSGVLTQYLDLHGLPIVATNSSVTVNQVPPCTTLNGIAVCEPNAYFGLEITSGQNNNKDNYTIILEIELGGNTKINQKINYVVVAGDGNCYSSYNKNDVGKSYFKFDLSNVDDDDTTLQFTIVPKNNTELWYLYLDYSGTFTSNQNTEVTVSLTVQSTAHDDSSSGSHDDSSSGSHDDDDSHTGRKVALIIIGIVVAILVIAGIAVVVIRRRRAHFESLE